MCGVFWGWGWGWGNEISWWYNAIPAGRQHRAVGIAYNLDMVVFDCRYNTQYTTQHITHNTHYTIHNTQ